MKLAGSVQRNRWNAVTHILLADVTEREGYRGSHNGDGRTLQYLCKGPSEAYPRRVATFNGKVWDGSIEEVTCRICKRKAGVVDEPGYWTIGGKKFS
jgi:hypothetical protein